MIDVAVQLVLAQRVSTIADRKMTKIFRSVLQPFYLLPCVTIDVDVVIDP